MQDHPTLNMRATQWHMHVYSYDWSYEYFKLLPVQANTIRGSKYFISYHSQEHTFHSVLRLVVLQYCITMAGKPQTWESGKCHINILSCNLSFH